MYDQKYLEDLISNEVEENLSLEYKSALALNKRDQKKTNELSKDVAAFANANGGIIIYGMTEENQLPKQIDPVLRSEISREWIEQKIQDNIRPKLPDYKIYPIKIDGDDDKVVYLIEISKSLTAHQSNDKKYYRRHNFNVLAMYDHEIRDIMNRGIHPKMSLFFEIQSKTNSMGEPNPFGPKLRENASVTKFELVVYAGNYGNVLAKYVNCDLKIPSVIFESDSRTIDTSIKSHFSLDNSTRDVLDIEVAFNQVNEKLGPSKFAPILPKRKLKLDSNFPQLVRDFKFYGNIKIDWEVFADNSIPIKGSQLISEIKIVNK